MIATEMNQKDIRNESKGGNGIDVNIAQRDRNMNMQNNVIQNYQQNSNNNMNDHTKKKMKKK